MKQVKVFLLFFAITCISHLPFLNLPPVGAHVWRQCNTLAISRNFAEESMDIFHPRIDRRNETNGITGANFPLFEWQLAGVYKVFGDYYIVSRLYSALIFTFSMFAFYLLMLSLRIDRKLAIWGGIGLLSIPQFYYDSINALPDIYALGLAILSAFYLLKFKSENWILYLLASSVLAALGGMIKFQFLIIPLSFYVLFEWKKWSALKLLILHFILSILPVLLWYRHAIELTKFNNLKEFGLWIKPISMAEKLNTLFTNIVSDFPELLIGFPLLIFLLFVIIKFTKHIRFKSDFSYLIVLWLLGFVCFYFIAIERMQHHSYYFMAVLPLSVLIVVKLANKNHGISKWLPLVIILNFIWAGVRIIPSRWVESKYQVPKEFIDNKQLSDIRSCIPRDSKCLVGPDKSGCIYFYFTHTKGYSFEDYREINTIKVEGLFIDVLKRNGVRYIISNEGEALEQLMLRHSEWQEIKAVGAFKIWTLR